MISDYIFVSLNCNILSISGDSAEADFVLSEISSLVSSGKYKPHEIAILYR